MSPAPRARLSVAALLALATLAAGAGSAALLSVHGSAPPAPEPRIASNALAPSVAGAGRVTLVAGATGVPAQSAEPEEPPGARAGHGDIVVDAPHAHVRVAPERGKVRVEAPFAFVNVDADAGRARIRAPGVDLDLRW